MDVETSTSTQGGGESADQLPAYPGKKHLIIRQVYINSDHGHLAVMDVYVRCLLLDKMLCQAEIR